MADENSEARVKVVNLSFSGFLLEFWIFGFEEKFQFLF
jgi:hypothetical protein